jgi:glutathione S-transferase
MPIKLHTCGNTWVHGRHPCWEVMKALDDAGVPYEQVKHPSFGRWRRKELEALSGQRVLPVLELEDGTVIRAESKELAARIRAGELTGGSARPAG